MIIQSLLDNVTVNDGSLNETLIGELDSDGFFIHLCFLLHRRRLSKHQVHSIFFRHGLIIPSNRLQVKFLQVKFGLESFGHFLILCIVSLWKAISREQNFGTYKGVINAWWDKK